MECANLFIFKVRIDALSQQWHLLMRLYDFRRWDSDDLNSLTAQSRLHLYDTQTQCVPGYLWRRSGGADHNQITKSLLVVYICLQMWARSGCGHNQEKDMFKWGQHHGATDILMILGNISLYWKSLYLPHGSPVLIIKHRVTQHSERS